MQNQVTNLSLTNFIKDSEINKQTSKLYRAMNLANAVHEVTKNVIENIPKKDNINFEFYNLLDLYKRLDKQANEVMYSAHNFAKINLSDNKILLQKEILFLVSLINIANKNYSMSDMNAELLVKGCTYLRDTAQSIVSVDEHVKDKNQNHTTHNETDRKFAEDLVREIENIKDTDEKILSAVFADNRAHTVNRYITENLQKREGEIKSKTNPNHSQNSAKIPQNFSTDARKSGRREQVLALLSKTPISIKEISDKIVGCSEKTIQRELNALLDAKKIVRVGEKRWSRYTLAM